MTSAIDSDNSFRSDARVDFVSKTVEYKPMRVSFV